MNRFNPPVRQKGLSMLSWMIVVGVAVFFFVLGMKLVPSYLEFYSVQSVLQSVQQDPKMRDSSGREIRDSIIKRLKINGVYDFDRDSISVKKDKNRINVRVVYEIRKNMAGNIDAVMHFEDQVDF